MNFFSPLVIIFSILSLHAQDNVSYYSQYDQDQYLHEHIFKNKRNGVFVEIGAHNGIFRSNTYFFEKEMGWTGICIEPHSDRFAELINNRPYAICLPICIGDFDGNVPFFKIDGYSEMLSGVLSEYHPLHWDRVNRELAEYNQQATTVTIPVKTLNTVLEEYNIYEIDLLSIDVEGSEESIIKSIDYQKFKIHYILIENNYRDDSFIADHLARNGYTFVTHIHIDDLYALN